MGSLKAAHRELVAGQVGLLPWHGKVAFQQTHYYCMQACITPGMYMVYSMAMV